MGSEPTTIGPLSRLTGVNVETVRYYERIGLMPSPPRSEGGYRLYGDAHRQRLTFIRRSRELGFTIEEVRCLLNMVDGEYTCAQVKTLTEERLEDVRSKIADLRRLERTLDRMAAQCAGGTAPECPVIDALSR